MVCMVTANHLAVDYPPRRVIIHAMLHEKIKESVMNYDKVKQIAQLAFDTPYPQNERACREYDSVWHILLAKDDPNLKHAMKHCGYEFEITETMTSEDGWKEFRRMEHASGDNNGGENNMVTWDGYQI